MELKSVPQEKKLDELLDSEKKDRKMSFEEFAKEKLISTIGYDDLMNKSDYRLAKSIMQLEYDRYVEQFK